jgi:hypothetical protein
MSLSSVPGGRNSTRARPAEVRLTLTAALGAVSGVTAYPTMPDQAVAGAGWVRWIQTIYGGKLDVPGSFTYEAYVTLPAVYVSETVDQGDAFLEAVVPALWPVARVELAEPVIIQFQDRQSMPGLRLRVITR